MNVQEELTKLLMESYDRGVEDAKQEALAALEMTVAVMVAKEREACEEVCDDLYRAWILQEDEINPPDAIDCKRAIRARGNT